MTKSLAKTLIILATVLLIALLIIGIVQSFQITALKNQAIIAKEKSDDMADKLQSVEEEIAYKESENYYRDYYEQEEGYGKEGDIIYKQN